MGLEWQYEMQHQQFPVLNVVEILGLSDDSQISFSATKQACLTPQTDKHKKGYGMLEK